MWRLDIISYQIEASINAVIPSHDNKENALTLAMVALEAVGGVGVLSTAEAFPSNVLSRPHMFRTSCTSPGRSGVFRTSSWPL